MKFSSESDMKEGKKETTNRAEFAVPALKSSSHTTPMGLLFVYGECGDVPEADLNGNHHALN